MFWWFWKFTSEKLDFLKHLNHPNILTTQMWSHLICNIFSLDKLQNGIIFRKIRLFSN